MIKSLKRYHVTLKTLSPVHIGWGEVVNKKEYIYDRHKGILYYPDLRDMLGSLRVKQLTEKYEKFMLEKSGDLFSFLSKNNVSWSEWRGNSIPVFGDVNNTLNKIHTFVKDPFGLPYVPGSSVKGAFRTIILNHETTSRRSNGAPVMSSVSEAKDARQIEFKLLSSIARHYKIKGKMDSKRIEAEVLNSLNRLNHNGKNRSNAVNDIMAAFSYSDSEPIPKNSLIICQKIDAAPISKNCEVREWSTFRECLKPETEISLTVTVDRELLKKTLNNDMFERELYEPQGNKEDKMPVFLNWLREFNIAYTGEYRNYFTDMEPILPTVIYIGGGTGFLTKTMLLGLLDRDQRLRYTSAYLNKRFRTHKHFEDIKLGVSPHIMKLTKFNGKFYEMGKCTIDITEF